MVKECRLAVAIHKTPATQISTAQKIAILALEFMRSHPFFAVTASGPFSTGPASSSFPYLIRDQQNQQNRDYLGSWGRSAHEHPRTDNRDCDDYEDSLKDSDIALWIFR
jgi:hypothetical protein